MKKVMLILVMIMTLISNPILVSASSYYQVDGDSMNPIFNDGDTIKIVSEFYEDGDMVVAQLKDGRKIVKRLMGERIVSVGHGTSYPVSEVTILGAAEYVPMSMEELERYGFSWESVLAEGVTIVQIAAGLSHSLALTNTGVIYAWGWNFAGQLGNGNTVTQHTPVKVSDNGTIFTNSGVTAIAAGNYFSLALKDGVVYAWGSGSNGRLGNGHTSDQNTPVKVSDNGTIFTNSGVDAISAGEAHSLAIKDGVVYAWGAGSEGRLGNGHTTDQNTPVEVSGGVMTTNAGVTAISAGGSHSLAIKGGEVYAWGAGSEGGLGNGDTTDQNMPVKVMYRIDIQAIPGVTAPVNGATPVTTITETAQYTGTVTWSPADNPFGASTVYTATITLTPKAGFTLTGVAENFFTVAGATATNTANTGVVTAVFPATDTTINIAAIPGVTAPVRTATPVTTITETDQYTGTVTWNPAHNPFGASTAYTATITLTPKAGFTLTGVTENFFTVAGATTTNAANTGVITAVFPATGAAPDTPINIAAIPGVTAPVRTATPVTTITETAQYTGTVTWNPAHNPFGASTVYTATITLTPKAGFTLTGVAENFFTVAGATATNAANTGVITAVFPATGAAPAPSGGGGGGGGSSTPTPTPSEPKSEPVIVIVNNKEEDAGKRTESKEDGKTTTTIQVNNIVIESKIEEAIQNNPTGVGNKIQVPVNGTNSQQIKVELTGDIVKKLENNNFNVSIKRDTVDYIIPAKEFTISSIAERLGVKEESLQDIKVEVRINKLDEGVIETYNEVAKRNNAVIIFPPVEFEIVAKTTKTDGTIQEHSISRFSNYVERVLEIPAGTDPSKITTGVVFNPDGTYSHVPSLIYQKDSKWYASINSLTNSTYSVIWNPVTVKSVANHWSKDAVNDMASRLVIFNTETFAPNKAITRADFAEYIVRALGLYREGSTHTNKFSDVKKEGDRTLAILIASEYGIVSGYPDGTFRPEALITREEAMTMYQRAMKVTKLVGTDINRYQSYTDYKQVSNWASPYVKEVLSAHVFNGNTATTISPKTNLTYAEAAQAIKNLLVESKLINK